MANAKRKNFKWTRDGLILALALYKEYYSKSKYSENMSSGEEDNSVNPDGETWNKYNYFVRNLPDKDGNFINKDATSKQGVEGKYKGFISLNGSDIRKGPKSTKCAEKIWEKYKDEFAPDKINEIGRLEQKAEEIIKSIVLDAETIEGSNEIERLRIKLDAYGFFLEGREKIIWEHKLRERNPTIVKDKKEAVKREKGFLACEVCGFIFKDTYGKHGEDFIECHHKKPIAQMKIGDKTFPTDLALVCSNCHRMIHHPIGDRKDCLTIEELREIIVENKSK